MGMLMLVFDYFQSPDGRYIACGAIDGIINIFDMTTGKLLHTLDGNVSFWSLLKTNINKFNNLCNSAQV